MKRRRRRSRREETRKTKRGKQRRGESPGASVPFAATWVLITVGGFESRRDATRRDFMHLDSCTERRHRYTQRWESTYLPTGREVVDPLATAMTNHHLTFFHLASRTWCARACYHHTLGCGTTRVRTHVSHATHRGNVTTTIVTAVSPMRRPRRHRGDAGNPEHLTLGNAARDTWSLHRA